MKKLIFSAVFAALISSSAYATASYNFKSTTYNKHAPNDIVYNFNPTGTGEISAGCYVFSSPYLVARSGNKKWFSTIESITDGSKKPTTGPDCNAYNNVYVQSKGLLPLLLVKSSSDYGSGLDINGKLTLSHPVGYSTRGNLK